MINYNLQKYGYTYTALVTFDLKYLDGLHVELFQTVHSLYPFMTCCEKISKCKSKVESNVCFQKVS